MKYWFFLLSCAPWLLCAQQDARQVALQRYYQDLQTAVGQWQGYPIWQVQEGPFAALPSCPILDSLQFKKQVIQEQKQAVLQIELGWRWSVDAYRLQYRLRLEQHPHCWLYYEPCEGHWLEYNCAGE